MLALLSDWICFSLAAAPEAFEGHYKGHSSADLIDIFLFTNVASSFLVTDVVARFGMQRTIRFASALMTCGCWFRSGFGIFVNPSSVELVSFSSVVIGTILVGAAQPFFQCTPPLLSAQWFASGERATSTAVALNFNQIGIATGFLLGGAMAKTEVGLRNYNALIAVTCTILAVGTWLQFQNLPPVPPSTSEIEKLMDEANGKRDPPFFVSVKQFFATQGFTRPLVAFICSISVTNIVGVSGAV
jgi:FLVCR family feline leukemia virus subgroup C receptor-related protein